MSKSPCCCGCGLNAAFSRHYGSFTIEIEIEYGKYISIIEGFNALLVVEFYL